MPQTFLRSLSTLAAVFVAFAGCSDPGPSPVQSPDGSPNTAAPASSTDARPPPPAAETGAAVAATPTGPLGGGPVNQWTWYDVPESTCGNGTPTGLGVNVGTGDDVVVFMMGGGLCADEATCAGTQSLGSPLAYYVMGGFHEPDFRALIEGHGQITVPPTGGLMDRNLPNNPYRNSSFVFVPYCTGDLHLGSTTQQWIGPSKMLMHYAGLTNLDAFLSKIVPSFSHASRVTLVGSSAGAFGATIHYERVKNAFGNIRVDLVADSGPWFHSSMMPLAETGMNVAWAGYRAIPDGCGECKIDIDRIYEYDSKIAPNSRFAFLSHDQDSLLSVLSLMPSYPVFYFAMKEFTLDTIRPLANWRYFIAPGTSHTLIANFGETSASSWNYVCDEPFPLLPICLKGHNVATDPTSLGDWLTGMAADDPNWSSLTSITP